MIRYIFSLFKLDIFIDRMSLKRGPFRFSYENDGVNKEWWGLGHYIVISPLQMSPQI
jgi:hypothetical protein